MCLIIYKPAGIAWDFQAIINGFNNNPDGAGLMFPWHDRVQIERGFWKLEGLLGYLDSNDLTAKNAILHFRWATHGKINITNCHPFPVRRQISEKRHIKTNLAVAHNGIIPGAVKSNISDTLQFVTGALIELQQHIARPWFPEFLANATNSKFAFMQADRVTLAGDFVENNGISYSNTSYLPYILKDSDTFLDSDIAREDFFPLGYCWECGVPTDDELCDVCTPLYGEPVISGHDLNVNWETGSYWSDDRPILATK